MTFQRQQEIQKFVDTALECSVYVAPRTPGLTVAELIEVGGRLGLKAGEIQDGLAHHSAWDDDRLRRAGNAMWDDFNFPRKPDFRNVEAFDFVVVQFKEIAKAHQWHNAKMDRATLVVRASAGGLPELDVEAAISVLLASEYLTEDDKGVLRVAQNRQMYPTPKEQQSSTARNPALAHMGKPDDSRQVIYDAVKDVVSRRTDGRPAHADPFDALGSMLTKLGLRHFLGWWTQTVNEMKRAEPTLSPISKTVLAAAVVEGALTFVVKHAQARSLGVFGSKTFEGPPRTWSLDDLVASAVRGGESAILTAAMKARADILFRTRQRIHAGRMLEDYPNLPLPDLRPEEATDAEATAAVVVRAILDWLEKYPPR